ncbi:MAG: hypothetical protein LQ343_007815 [Gyalolechia ehrenbergii]|nr:MAG: hypothetical protein LQ343_007815 [Gyalolechia ehrenbergii]
MAPLVCKLTPPRKGSEMSQKSPNDFLTSAEAMSPLKRTCPFRRLSSESLKKLRLEPAPVIGDSPITIYHERTQALMPEDRGKLHVHIPFEGELEQIRELQSLKPEVEKLRAELNRFQKSRLRMLIGNALIDLARMIAKRYKSELIDDPSTTRLQQFAANVDDAQLQQMGIPKKFWSSLRKLEKYITTRNQQAHETSEDFAQLLLHEQFKEGHVFELWKDIFPLLYGAPVEEIAARKEEDDDKMLLGSP